MLTELTGFVGNAYEARSKNADTERLVNWYPETIQSKTNNAPARVWFVPTPGLRAFTSGLDGPPRGAFAQDGRVFFVAGSHLYELNGAGVATDRGFVGVDDQPASLSSNGHGGLQLLVISAGKGWIFKLNTNELLPITSPGFPPHAVMGVYVASYFCVMQAGTSKVYISSPNNGLAWDASNVIQTEFTSDTLAAIAELKGQLWLIGSQNTEVWQATVALSIFEPILGAVSNWGTPAPWSVAVASDRLWMLGQSTLGNAVVLVSDGLFINKEISTYAISLSLSRIQDLQECVGYVYQQEGHSFVTFTFPTTGPTWSYDILEGLWHERGTWNEGLKRFFAHRVTCHAFGFGKHLVGDKELGNIYEMSLDFGTDDGTPIRRVRRCPHLNSLRQWIFYQEFTLDIETGNALDVTADPGMTLAWSKDGGHTFSPPRSRSFGLQGQYAKTVKWTMAGGRAKDMVYELAMTASTPPNVLNAYLRLEPGLGLS